MRSGFCYNGNKLNNLLISTPTADQANSGYFVSSAEFNKANYCVGFRFRLTDVTGEQTLIQSINTVTSGVNFSLTMADDQMSFINATNTVADMFGISSNVWYYFYARVTTTGLAVHLYNHSTGSVVNDSYVINAHDPNNSKVFFLNNSAGNNKIHGTLCDFVFVPEGADEFQSYKSGAYKYKSDQMHCPMREGSGATCRFLGRTDLALGSGGLHVAPTWATVEGTDVGRRWL